MMNLVTQEATPLCESCFEQPPMPQQFAVCPLCEGRTAQTERYCRTCAVPREPPPAWVCQPCLERHLTEITSTYGFAQHDFWVGLSYNGEPVMRRVGGWFWHQDGFVAEAFRTFPIGLPETLAVRRQDAFTHLITHAPEVLIAQDKAILPPALLALYRARLVWDPDAPIERTLPLPFTPLTDPGFVAVIKTLTPEDVRWLFGWINGFGLPEYGVDGHVPRLLRTGLLIPKPALPPWDRYRAVHVQRPWNAQWYMVPETTVLALRSIIRLPDTTQTWRAYQSLQEPKGRAAEARVAAWQALQQGSCAIPRDVARWLRERGLIEEEAPKVYRLSEAAMLLAQAAAYQVPSEVIPIEQLCFQGV